MPILGTIASSYASASLLSAYESIATISVGSDTTTVSFSSIPSTFRHLQLRAIARGGRARNSADGLYIQLNGGFPSTMHELQVNPSWTGDVQTGFGNGTGIFFCPGANAETGSFGVIICNFYDYASTSQYKSASGYSTSVTNDEGIFQHTDLTRDQTSAITTILLGNTDGTTNGIKQYSHFALYGLKGA